MPAIAASAPGKVILFGEHAVVYGHPAIAAPVDKVKARAVVQADPRGAPGEVRIQAPGIGLDSLLSNLPSENPLAYAVLGVLSRLGISRPPACKIRITSTIPVASGMGSGAAVSVAVIRAFSAFMGSPMENEEVSALAYEVERIYHGTPSGIDNAVVTYAMPVYFTRGQPIETLAVPPPGTSPVLPTLQVPGHPEIYVVGDLASISENNRVLPMVAQVAIQSAITAAQNMLRQLDETAPQPFYYRDRGSMITIGRNAAGVAIGSRTYTGFFAWILWLAIHLFNLIGFRNRMMVLVNWAWDYLLYERAVRFVFPSEILSPSKSSSCLYGTQSDNDPLKG